MSQKGIHQGAVGISRRRMHHQSGGLVHDNKVRILVDDPQGDGLGAWRHRRRRRNENGKRFRREHAPRGILDSTLAHDFHQTAGDQRLQTGARERRNRIRQ